MQFRADWKAGGGPLADRLSREVQEAIMIGWLAPGSLLPSERRIAETAGVSRVTVAAAIDQLVRTGWIDRRNRARSVVRFPSDRDQSLAARANRTVALDLSAARVAAPIERIVEALDKARPKLTPHLLGDGRSPLGLTSLRELIAQRYQANGLVTSTEQIVVTNGAMGALNAVLDARPGRVLVEDPTYHVALRLLASKRRKIMAWPRTEPWGIRAADELARQYSPAVTYLVPDFHNPTGLLVGDADRERFARIRDRFGVIVVDETLRDLDLRTGHRPMPQHLAASVASAITIGGLSKSVWSGLRIGWMRLPTPTDVPAFSAIAEFQPVPILDQLVAVEMWPHLTSTIATRVERLRHQRDVLVDALRECGLSARRPEGGLVAWVDLKRPVASALVAAASEHGIALSPGSTFSVASRLERYVRLPFTSDADSIRESVATISRCLDQID
ncbi:MAG: PLP-dependent aminotransferase family protein [Ilumatobacteraceae bacterium]